MQRNRVKSASAIIQKRSAALHVRSWKPLSIVTFACRDLCDRYWPRLHCVGAARPNRGRAPDLASGGQISALRHTGTGSGYHSFVSKGGRDVWLHVRFSSVSLTSLGVGWRQKGCLVVDSHCVLFRFAWSATDSSNLIVPVTAISNETFGSQSTLRLYLFVYLDSFLSESLRMGHWFSIVWQPLLIGPSAVDSHCLIGDLSLQGVSFDCQDIFISLCSQCERCNGTHAQKRSLQWWSPKPMSNYYSSTQGLASCQVVSHWKCHHKWMKEHIFADTGTVDLLL